MRLMPEPMFSTTSMRYSMPNSSGFRGTLLVPQIRFRHARGQPARTDDLDPVLEDVDLDVGRRAVVAVRHRVRDGLPQRLLRQLRPFLPPHVPDDEELDVDLRQDPRHRVVDHRRHIPVEVPSIEDSHLLRAEDSAHDTWADVVKRRTSRARSHAPACVIRSSSSTRPRFRSATRRSMASGILARRLNRAQVSSSRSRSMEKSAHGIWSKCRRPAA